MHLTFRNSGQKASETELAFLKSAIAVENTLHTESDILQWIDSKKKATVITIEQVLFSEMKGWLFHPDLGNLVHETGKFFSIVGISVKTNWGKVPEWDQPIINQPEIGILGIISKKINGILYFLMQAKIEPGNINYVQLSPTLQATKSNYTQVHKGSRPLYLEYFSGEKKDVRILLDQLQSEQGARFLRKRNRNMIVEVEGEVSLHDNFIWMTLGQLKQMLHYDNIVNMDTRTVISGIPFGDYPAQLLELYGAFESIASSSSEYERNLLRSSLDRDTHLHETEQIISWITRQKALYELDVSRIPLKDVRRWVKTDYEIHHEEGKYFSVIGVNVEIGNREVQRWSQPLIKSAQEGIMAFLIKKIDGVYHFLVQAKLEAGNLDIIELAPTVQCLTGNYRKGLSEYEPYFLNDVLNAKPDQIRYSSFQSEEGGRFFKEQNKNMIIEVDDRFPNDVPESYCWMTLNQLKDFLKFNNYLNGNFLLHLRKP
ncbi:NDP-hexose 2,3-dehydratase [Candidatus Roizmanbacteria bacterium]|nr:NDP-hexose 2,3-dehydratase [Candidatus Roizmanbacteria bacterium]